jgi:hypothetical protein
MLVLETLSRFTTLEFVHIEETQVSEAGVGRLQAELPDYSNWLSDD